MEDVGHSPLLKFLVSGGDTKMSEPASIESEVPGEQELREVSNADGESSTANLDDKAQNDASAGISTLASGDTGEIATADDFTLQPVITVTKQETTLTKGELKLQKVTVTEDISQTSESTGDGAINRRLTYEIHTKIPHPTGANGSKREESPSAPQATGETEGIESRRNRTKIPMARFRQAVDRVKREKKEMKNAERVHETVITTHRKSSIPRLKDSKIQNPPINKDAKISKADEKVSVGVEDEFDKIFREMSEKESFVVSSNEECVSQVEHSFEEIIHAYEDKNEAIGVDKVRQSRIPLLKRRSEHDIEFPRSRGRLLLKKSLSVDGDKIKSPTTATIERHVTTGESKTYVETNAQKMIYSSKTTYSDVSRSKHGIDRDNVYEVVEVTDEAISSGRERDDGLTDTDETVPIIDEPEEAESNVTENYDDMSVTSETQLTNITSEQVRFDKQVVSKIYKIDFTENSFELTDSEAAAEMTNEYTQWSDAKQSDVFLSTSIGEKRNVIIDHKGSKYERTTEIHEHKNTVKESISKSNTIETVRPSDITHQDIVQNNVLDKSDIIYSTKNSNSIGDNVVQGAEIYSTRTLSSSDKIYRESTDIIQNTDESVETKDSNLSSKESITVEMKLRDKNTAYLINKYSKKETLDTTDKNIKDITKERRGMASDESKEAKDNNNEKKDIVKATNIQIFTEDGVKFTKRTDSSTTNLLTEEIIIETKSKDIIDKDNTKDSKDNINNTSQLAGTGTKNVNIKSNYATAEKETEESSRTIRNFNTFKRSESLASYKSIDGYDITKHSYSPTLYKSQRSEVNGHKTEHDDETYKVYSDVFTKMSAARTSTGYESKTEKSGQEFSTTSTDTNRLSVPEIEQDSEENIPILKGKVSRIVRRISSVDNTKEDRDFAKELPKKKSILSKIAMFERDDPNEPFPSPRNSHSDYKTPRGLAALRQTSKELREPKIVDEIFKGYRERNKYNKTNVGTENDDQEEITIEIKDVQKEMGVTRSDSNFESKLYDYKVIKNGITEFDSLKSFYTQDGTRTEGKKLGKEAFTNTAKEATLNSSVSAAINSKSEQITDKKEINTDEKVSEDEHVSGFKTANVTLSESNIKNESTIKAVEINSTKTGFVNVKAEQTKETINISKTFDKNERNRSHKSKESIHIGLTKEVSKEVTTKERIVRRDVQRRDSFVSRATSVVEEDLGDVIRGKVRGIITRINSMERLEQTRKKIEDRERLIGSVAERIALFENLFSEQVVESLDVKK